MPGDPAIEAAAIAYLEEGRRPGIRAIYWHAQDGPAHFVDWHALVAAIRAYLAAQPAERTVGGCREELP